MTGLAPGTFAKLLKQLFEPFNMAFRLFQMLFESIFQFRR
jgi:hypothetical protein